MSGRTFLEKLLDGAEVEWVPFVARREQVNRAETW